jgi:hypothetical protein
MSFAIAWVLVFVPAGPPAAAQQSRRDATARYGFRRLMLTKLPRAPADVEATETDGTRLYVRQLRNGQAIAILRLDPRTGTPEARYEVAPTVPPNGSLAHAFTDEGVVVLDGDRSTAKILDRDTLRVRTSVPMPPNSRTDLPSDGVIAGPLWVGHKLIDSDVATGNLTTMGVTRVVPSADAPETRPVPACGSKGGAQANDRLLVVNVECSGQIAIIDLRTGRTTTIPSLQSRVDVTRLGDQIWARWKDLGYVARVDPQRRRFTAIDLNAEGPLLAQTYELHLTGGAVWATGHPADPELPPIAFKIDPRRVRVVARVWGSIPAIIGKSGYAVGADGRVGRFDPGDVRGGAPRRVVRPTTGARPRFRPETAEERRVVRAFTTAFDYRRSNEEAAASLGADPELLELRGRLVGVAAQLFPDLEVVVTEIAIRDGLASLSYDFRLDGAAAIAPFSAELRRQRGQWVVTKESVCSLARTAGISTC